jgi:hypothetical protein
MSNFVVRVTSHYCGNGYNVDLIRWDKGGSGMKVCKAFNVSSEQLKDTGMIKYWHRIKYYYLTHDGIEMLLLACMWGCLAWMAYHAVVGIVGRFF